VPHRPDPHRANSKTSGPVAPSAHLKRLPGGGRQLGGQRATVRHGLPSRRCRHAAPPRVGRDTTRRSAVQTARRHRDLYHVPLLQALQLVEEVARPRTPRRRPPSPASPVPSTMTARTSSRRSAAWCGRPTPSGCAPGPDGPVASGVGSHQGSGRNSWWSSSADPAGVTPTRKTPTWQLSSLPSRPLCCRAHPGGVRPLLGVSTLVDDPDGPDRGAGREGPARRRRGTGPRPGRRRRAKGGRHRRTSAGPRRRRGDQQGDRLDALALGQTISP